MGGWVDVFFLGVHALPHVTGWHKYLLHMPWGHHMVRVPSDFTDVLFASRMAALVVTGVAPFNAATLQNPGKLIAARSVTHDMCNWHITRDLTK